MTERGRNECRAPGPCLHRVVNKSQYTQETDLEPHFRASHAPEILSPGILPALPVSSLAGMFSSLEYVCAFVESGFILCSFG